MDIKVYAKSIAAVVATVLSAIYISLGDGSVSSTEWVNVAIAGVGALTVFYAPNVPFAKYTKSVVAAATAGLIVLQSAITDGVTQTELIQIVLAVAGAVGVYAVKNKGQELV